jgi:hypothetical protein
MSNTIFFSFFVSFVDHGIGISGGRSNQKIFYFFPEKSDYTKKNYFQMIPLKKLLISLV